MSFRVITWAFDQIRAGRSPSASCSLVLLKLADRSNDDGCCWPGQDRIGADIGLSDETVRQCCRHLEKAALVKILHRKDQNGRDLSNLYFFQGFTRGGQNFTTPPQESWGESINMLQQQQHAAACTQTVDAVAAPRARKARKKRIQRASGIVVWLPDDLPEEAEEIEQQHDKTTVDAAVAAVKAIGQEPVPGLVLAAIERQRREREAAERRAAAEAERQARLNAREPIDPIARERGTQILAELRRKRAKQEQDDCREQISLSGRQSLGGRHV